MPRRNNRPENILPTLKGFKLHFEEETAPRTTTTVADRFAGRFDELGSLVVGRDVRTPYLEAALGRPATAEALERLADPFRRRVRSLEVHPNNGIVYVTGGELVRTTHYGLQGSDQERLTPQQNVGTAVDHLRAASVLAPSAHEVMEVPLKFINAKPWGEHAVRIFAKVGDAATRVYTPAVGQVLGEKIAAHTILGGEKPNPNQSLNSIRHSLFIGVADSRDIPAINAVLAAEQRQPRTTIQLAGIGFVNDPQPNNRPHA